MRLTRVTLLIIALIIGAGFYHLLRQQLSLVEDQTFQLTEETLVDTAQLMAAFIEADMSHDTMDSDRFRSAFTEAHKRKFEAMIHGHHKTHMALNAYVTDAKGNVIFDSGGQFEGMNLLERRDVKLTLKGEYGARSTRSNKEDDNSSVMYIGALLGPQENPWGVVTVYKPQADVLPIVIERRHTIWWGTSLVGAGILFLILAVFIWQYRPIGLLTEYARDIEQGKRPTMPSLGAGKEVNTLAHALESMREALEGRRYAERYVQTLTHEMKSPLAAIRGAAELLMEDMPAGDRDKFLGNIRAEAARADRLLNRLLELSALEGRSSLENGEPIKVAGVVDRAIDQARPPAEFASILLSTDVPGESISVRGDAFILRSAVTNLLENAIDFSPNGSTVEIHVRPEGGTVAIEIADRGPGIPDYAREKIYERFFSLRHHATSGRKGTGLGLTLVREAAELHGGSVHLENREGGGTLATLRLPIAGSAVS
ncbi:MAG: two-component system sensor histidine kinase CreC [Akkermansiaceae bacterium]|nr:two-component system sensor histidine kinase CreC [Akkermansiaceae bacterium]